MMEVLLVMLSIYATLITLALWAMTKELKRSKVREPMGHILAMQWALDTYKKYGDNPYLWEREFQYELNRAKYRYGSYQDVGSSEFS